MMAKTFVQGAVLGLLFGSALATCGTAASRAQVGPVELRVDDLKAPLGIDDPAPRFSWQLSDSAPGAKQTAYEVQVGSSATLLLTGQSDVWTSGRIESSQTMNIAYAGPALKPSTKYLWRVKVWGAGGKPYPASAVKWWETGLMKQANWRAEWIGYETPEEATARKAPAVWVTGSDAKALAAERAAEQRIAYRATVTLNKPVLRAAVYATGQDTVAAWVNGTKVLTANPFPPWKQMPWKKYVRADVTGGLTAGTNAIAIETVHYVPNPNDVAPSDSPSMIATLTVEYADGSTEAFASGSDWKAAIHPAAGWQQKAFDDAGWKPAVALTQPPSPMTPPLLQPWIPDSVKALRHPFEVSKSVKSARIYATALGAYELFLNGKRVGDDILAPGWTDYRQHVKYQTYDVTAQLKDGKNILAALLAPGWYETPLEWFQQPNNYGDTPPALRAQMRIEHTDGSVEWVATDASWMGGTTSIQHSEIYDGETKDARSLWLDDSSVMFKRLEKVIPIEPKPVAIEAQDYPSIRAERTLSPKSMKEPKPGVYVYDFGQNFAGVEHIRVQGPRGTDVQLRFAEIVNDDGTIYTENLRTAKATDHFILSGNGVEEFTPQFTYHGFRYMELTGLPTAPAQDAVSAVVIHTDAPFAAKLDTGSAMINQLWSNILWGQRSNFVGVPSDCPQRDERLGWMADAQVFWRAASYNMDLAAFSRKFAGDMRGTQSGTPYFGIYSPGTAEMSSRSGAGWSDAGVIIPWTSWLQSGDSSVIEQNWEAMQKYLNAIESANPDGLWKRESGIPFGDWLSPEGRTDQVLVATAYWAYDVTLMEQMAEATGRKADAERYAKLFDKIQAAFQKQFVRDDGFVAGVDKGPSPFGERTHTTADGQGDTQTGYVLALHMNLLNTRLRALAAQKLADKIEANHGLLGTGFLGTPYLLEELTKTGHGKLAYSLLLNTRYPSWGYLIDHGATTMWERWNGDQMKADPSMNSYNHYAYGAVADWIYRYAAGVDTTGRDPGFHTVVLHPNFDARLGHVSFDYDSSYGPIHSDWTVQGKTAIWHVTIPANTTGWLDLETGDALGYKLDGKSLDEAKSSFITRTTRYNHNGYELAPGSYTFTRDL
jgi:alpha-L-rhamnosidase